MKKMWHENFMHENDYSMHEKEISMHENENFAQKCSWVNIPCMKLCTTQSPMKISGAKKSCQGRNNHFHASKCHFNALKFQFQAGKYETSMHEISILMKFSCHDFFMHGTFCTIANNCVLVFLSSHYPREPVNITSKCH